MNQSATTPEVICAGIIVADHICTPIDHLPIAGELVRTDGIQLAIGGCAANTSVDLAKLGVAATIVGRVGNDSYGELIRNMLNRAGVATGHVSKVADCETSQTMIVLVKGQDRRFVHSFGANAHFTAEDIQLDQFASAKVLYVGGYLLMPKVEPAALALALKSAQQAGIKTVLDVGIPGPGDYVSKLTSVLPFVDVFLPNEDEGRIILNEADPYEQARRFRDMGARTVVITRGEQGSILLSGDLKIKAGIFQVNYVDGSGSGDAFDAGFIYGLLNNNDLPTCLTMASALGASCVQAIGTTPGVFNRTELNHFLRDHQLNVASW